VRTGLAAAGVKPGRITLARVPGSHELPVAAQWLAQGGKRDVVIALGVLIGGDTNHHEMVGRVFRRLSSKWRSPRALRHQRCHRGGQFETSAGAVHRPINRGPNSRAPPSKCGAQARLGGRS